jgi:plastocyanin
MADVPRSWTTSIDEVEGARIEGGAKVTGTRKATSWLAGAVAVGLLAAGLPGLVASPAAAATQAVTITASGFVPRDVTVQIGDAVSFTNSDNTAHQVDFRGASGVTCSPNPLVLQAGQAGSCTFATAGNFAYSDPNKKGNTFKGSVTVAAAPTVNGSVTIAASAPLVVYGSKVTLTGKVSPAKGAVNVDLWARPYPETSFAKIATVASGGDGSYAFSLPTQIRTEYKAQFTDGNVKGESPAVTVSVRPKVTLSVRGVSGTRATLRAGVVSTLTYASKPVIVQRRNSQGGWTTVKTVRLGQFSTSTFTVTAPRGTSKWRVYLQASQAGAGYEASFSPTRRVVR